MLARKIPSFSSPIRFAVAAIAASGLLAACTASSSPRAAASKQNAASSSSAKAGAQSASAQPGKAAPGASANAPYDPFQPSAPSAAWFEPTAANSSSSGSFSSAASANQRRPAPARPPEFAMFGEIDATASARAAVPPDGSDNLRPITFASEGGDFDPTISRDGDRIFFASTAHSTAADIYVKNIDGSAITQLTADPAQDIMPTVSPDGRRIAFSSNRAGSWDIFIMSADGGQPVQITGDSTSQEMHPSWSPDGRLLVFCRLGEPSRRWEIWVAEADRPTVRRFLTFGLFPNWHPTNKTLVFQRSRERGDRYFSIWTIDNADSDPTPPTEIASSASAALINPRWSPDGQFVACAVVRAPSDNAPARRIEEADIWIIKADGSARANVTGGRWMNLMPTWGPNNSIFFVSDRSGTTTIWSTTPTQTILAMGSGATTLAPTAVAPAAQHLPDSRATAAAHPASSPAPAHSPSRDLQMGHAQANPQPQPAHEPEKAPTPLADAPTEPPAHEDEPPHN